MKTLPAFLLAIILIFSAVSSASAQTAESIWMTAENAAYKTGETVLVKINAVSATPIQGFTFQIRYDPACLQPTQSGSVVSGMNGLQLPQLPGLVDASYASASPQTVNGVVAEVWFVTLGACQTNLTLESAALAIRNEAGFAAYLPGISLGEKVLALTVDKERGVAATPAIVGTPLILGEAPAPTSTPPTWLVALLSMVFGGGIMFWVSRLFRKSSSAAPQKPAAATVQIKRGAQAGKSIPVHKLPCHIGSDPSNEICLDDPFVSKRHAKIFANNDGFYLLGLGGETYLNGAAVTKTATALKPGDMVRLGQNVFFTFAA